MDAPFRKNISRIWFQYLLIKRFLFFVIWFCFVSTKARSKFPLIKLQLKYSKRKKNSKANDTNDIGIKSLDSHVDGLHIDSVWTALKMKTSMYNLQLSRFIHSLLMNVIAHRGQNFHQLCRIETISFGIQQSKTKTVTFHMIEIWIFGYYQNSKCVRDMMCILFEFIRCWNLLKWLY